MKVDTSEILMKGKIPTDELDEFWLKLYGAIPTGLLFFGSLIAFSAQTTEQSVSFEHKLTFFIISTLLFGYTLLCYFKERQLKQIRTGYTKEENLKIFQSTIKQLGWRTTKKVSEYHKIIELPFVFGHVGHKLTVIIGESSIFYNLRNVGTPKGRMPYLLGIDTFKELKFKRTIKNYANKTCS